MIARDVPAARRIAPDMIYARGFANTNARIANARTVAKIGAQIIAKIFLYFTISLKDALKELNFVIA